LYRRTRIPRLGGRGKKVPRTWRYTQGHGAVVASTSLEVRWCEGAMRVCAGDCGARKPRGAHGFALFPRPRALPMPRTYPPPPGGLEAGDAGRRTRSLHGLARTPTRGGVPACPCAGSGLAGRRAPPALLTASTRSSGHAHCARPSLRLDRSCVLCVSNCPMLRACIHRLSLCLCRRVCSHLDQACFFELVPASQWY